MSCVWHLCCRGKATVPKQYVVVMVIDAVVIGSLCGKMLKDIQIHILDEAVC